MNETVTGSLDVLNSLQISADVEGLDTASKELFMNKEVLAVLLKGVVKEYKDYTLEEIMEFIEKDSITSEDDVSTGRTNTRIQGENVEFRQLNEKSSNFDIRFLSRNPLLSTDLLQINLHIDVEPQRNYKPRYPIEKRGIYYLARSLSSQLSLITEETDYNSLEKCYSIWICRDNIPKKEHYSISYYSIENTENFRNCLPKKEDYDLLTLIIIRLGDPICPQTDHVLEFLNALFYPHKKDFLDTVQKYIDFSLNEELKREVDVMSGLGMSILEEGRIEGRMEGREQAAIENVKMLFKNGASMELVMSSIQILSEQKIRQIYEEIKKEKIES